MKIRIIEEPRVIISNRDSLHNYFAWPTVSRLKNGRIAVGASGYRLGHVCPFGKSVLSFSEDEGKTYTTPSPIIDTPLDDRDAGLCPFGESGLILTSFNNTRTAQKKWVSESKRSDAVKNYISSYIDTITDESEEKYIGSTFKISFDNGVTFGELHKSPITSPHGPIELQDGSILWVGTRFTTTSDYQPIEVYKVNLDGSMEKISEIEKIFENGKEMMSCEPYAVQLKGGTIICHIRVEHNFTLYQTISNDNGKTWTKPIKLLKDYGGAPSHLLQLSNGTLLTVYGYRSNPYSIKAGLSNDDGKTWDMDNIIATKDTFSWDLGYPSTIELENGNLLTVFYGHFEKNGPAEIMQTIWKIEE